MRLLYPKKIKYRKNHLIIPKNIKYNQTAIFGQFSVVSLETSRITPNQLEAVRIALRRKRRVKRNKKLRKGVFKEDSIFAVRHYYFRRIFPNIQLTKKPAEVRMGKGKGGHYRWIAYAPKNSIIFEYYSMGKFLLRAPCYNRLTKICKKFPGQTKIMAYNSAFNGGLVNKYL